MKIKLQELINLLVEEYRTKTGKEITFEINPDSESGRKVNTSWIVPRIDAYIDGEKVGFLKISYIPQDRFDEHFSTIYDFLDHRGKTSYENFLEKPLDDQVKIISFDVAGWPGLSAEQIQKMPEDEKKQLVKTYTQILIKNNRQQFEAFKNFHVDKPLVDFIEVSEAHRRGRIAAALYEYGAKWLAKQGMKLYASGIQSDAAKTAWEWLRKNKSANIGTEKTVDGKTRTYLSYTQD